MSDGCTKPATTILFQVVGDETAIVQLPMGAFCADHLMSEKALHERHGERMAMQVIGPDVAVPGQTCCWLPETPFDELAGRRAMDDAVGMLESLQSPEGFQEMMAKDREWAARMPDTADLRMLMGIVAGMIVKRGAHPRLVADYVREQLREAFPSVFDGPI